ncbi:MAG: hypothetical protein AAFX02_03795 [Pseudomonadota bacterium]
MPHIRSTDIKHPPLTPGQFEAIRLELGLNKDDLALALGLSGKNVYVTIDEMIRGKRPISGPISTAMLAFADGWRPSWWPLEK